MNFRKIIMLSFLSLLLMNMQCNDDDITILPCGSEVLIDNNSYQTADSEYYNIENVFFNGDCLIIEYAASGCDGNTWVMTLIDSENIAESLPPQRYLKLTLYNNEACLAVFNKEETFDLVPLRIQGANEVLLNIEGFEEPVLYVY